jgi:hypothetical protein
MVDGQLKREGPLVVHKNTYRFGAMLGVNDPKALDLLARQAREAKRKGK